MGGMEIEAGECVRVWVVAKVSRRELAKCIFEIQSLLMYFIYSFSLPPSTFFSSSSPIPSSSKSVQRRSFIMPSRTVLFVTGFRRDLRARDLAYEFEIFGRLVRCDIPALRGPNSSPYAFIEFRREEAAEDAYFDMHGRMIDGQKISVQWAKNSPSSQWRHEESDRSVRHRAGDRRDDRRGGFSDRDDRRGGYPPRRRSRSRSPGYDRDRRRSPSPRRRSPSPRRSLSPPPRRERERSIGADDRGQRDDAALEDRGKERDVERERSVDRIERATQEDVAIRRERETSRDD